MGETTRDDMDSLTERVIGCGIEVHRTLGPGLLESLYRECLLAEMRSENLHVQPEHRVGLTYKGRKVADGLKLDFLTEGSLIVEVKAVDRLHPIHLAQVITYLKLTGCRVGLLMNFNAASLRGGLKRLVHPDFYSRKTTS